MTPIVPPSHRRSIRSREALERRRAPRCRPALEHFEPRVLLATFTVTNTDDSGPGSLRNAIDLANANPNSPASAPDVIDFDIPGAGVHAIRPLDSLPWITDPVVIDGYTQSDASANTRQDGSDAVLRIELDGSLAGAVAALRIEAGSSTVRGLAINRFQFGIVLATNGGGNAIEGNFIGTDPTGAIALDNLHYGILVASDGNRVGTDGDGLGDAGERNLISANEHGVLIYNGDQAVRNNVVAGNFIGTDATGTRALGNRAVGVLISAIFNTELLANRIGTNGDGVADDAERNIISGNAGYGVQLEGLATVVAGNYIGTDVTGTRALGNGTGIGGNSAYGAVSRIGTDGDGRFDDAERNIISGNVGVGIDLTGAGSVVAGNYIGTDVTGSVALGNLAGVVARAPMTIGGTTPAARNVVSGNLGNGIALLAPGTVLGNFIGTDATGAVALGNHTGITGGVGATVGGTAPGSRNIISGNSINVRLGQAGRVLGNYIGTDVTDTRAVGGGAGVGVYIADGGSDNVIGGTAAGEGNLISGNGGGVLITSFLTHPHATRNVVQGNLIGTDATGTSPLPNFRGVLIAENAVGNTIGGTAAGAGNTIAFNTEYGTAVSRGDGARTDFGTGNAIVGNAIFANGGLGIDLAIAGGGDGDGMTPNDPADGDGGSNGLQNFPVLSLFQPGAATRVGGTLNSIPSTTFAIDVYANNASEPGGYEGRRYLGRFAVATDGAGNASFNVVLPVATGATERITATATGPEGTSEFSQALAVTMTNTPPTAGAGGPYLVVRGGSVTVSASASTDPDQPASTLTYEWDFDADGLFDDATGQSPVFSAEGVDTLGTRTIAVRVTDGAGATDVATASLSVVAVALVPSPVAPGTLDLVVGGTSGNDLIVAGRSLLFGAWYASITSPTPSGVRETLVILTPHGGGFDLEFSIGGIQVGISTVDLTGPIGRVVAYGQAGNDTIWATAWTVVPAWLHGGPGDDNLKGGPRRRRLAGRSGR